ncbi:unnamed protein product [Enterobius vermicularis]|uniref:Apple domain-containing protein n=1 Tax=Enterobius vermicularis TaxID=51028 RepID=A0A3P6INW5_ENTVE|nr:unnamed protein product [Enterobius vermicularis]
MKKSIYLSRYKNTIIYIVILIFYLKPCFERYLGERLINLYPYHSEWRMKTVEECLEFCAASSSRCKSIVHERHKHICHYFLEDGSDHAIPSAGSIYLKVTAKESCKNEEIPVWLTVENAILGIRSLQKKTDADYAEACKAKCNLITVNCPAFTYDETEQKCILYTSDLEAVEKLSYNRANLNDFSIRTSTKFCYPDGLELFKNCSEFTAFHDYVLDVLPREEFDGMPYGKEGLHACLELCVLSPNYYCKSATFITDKGICRLSEENSLSRPENFREASDTKQIYFENTCDRYYTGLRGRF